jgi:hypothetical protein
VIGSARLRVLLGVLVCVLALADGCLFAGGFAAAAAPPFGGSGEEAGQLNGPLGVGLDRESGDVYVGEFLNERVSKFDGSGNFLLAWGWQVNRTSPAEELQTCTITTGCRKGSPGGGAGQFGSSCGAAGVAVDNDPLSSSYKDVYVVDFCGHRVEKFSPEGKFLLKFGGHNGAFEGAFGQSYIAVGPGGAVYVGDSARVQVFEPTGVWREDISLAGLSTEGRVTALAVDSSGDVFVKDQGVAGVREFEPGGIEKAVRLDEEGGESVEAITLDSSGDLFVADSSGGFHLLEYSPAGVELASFGSKTVPITRGIVFSDALGELYVTNYSNENDVWVLAPPPPGPLIEPGSESAAAGPGGTATFEAKIDPEGHATTYHFEYVSEAAFQSGGYAGASSTASVALGSGFGEEAASAGVTKLAPGIYHYRVVASNECSAGSTCTVAGPDQTLTTALIQGPWASDVANTSATLSARINPLGVSTSYRLEYGSSSSYGHVLSGNVGEGSGYVLVSYHEQELQPGTTYHYRLVITTGFGVFEGPDHTFTTQAAATQGFGLADGRAWELVSPANKKGSLIGSQLEPVGAQAADDGNRIIYNTAGTNLTEEPHSKSLGSQVLSVRGAGGWGTRDLALPIYIQEGTQHMSGAALEYRLFSPDLSRGIVEPGELNTPLLSPEATERTEYLYDSVTGKFAPLVTAANVPPGTQFGGEERGSSNNTRGDELKFVAATPDLSHIIIKTPLKLTPDAIAQDTTEEASKQPWNLYEWSGGRLQLVSKLPNGEPLVGNGFLHARLAGTYSAENFPTGWAARAISADGRRVAWMVGDPYAYGGHFHYQGLYVRDMVEEKTVPVGHNNPVFQVMSSDGSRIFYVEGGDLYEFDYETGASADLTAGHGASERSAGVRLTVSDVSEDGTSVYFVASGVLAAGAVSGEDNLYLLHEGSGGWSTTFIATLSGQDSNDWSPPGVSEPEMRFTTSRVSPDGRYLAFMSDRALTGYDNVDAVSGVPDEEVYLYDAARERLVCASCNPSGARPVGAQDKPANPLLFDYVHAWTREGEGGGGWLAGSVPGWEPGVGGNVVYQPRYLLDNGRLFFNSPDALAAQATDGLENVYEYEPPGVGDCTSASATFSERSDGCVNLISSGVSAFESEFYDASATGNDVFFITASKLVPEDYDQSYDVYDAHVCSSALPCRAAPVPAPACTSGDSCKAAPTPQPLLFGPAPSATFSGTGNVVASPGSPAVKGRSLTRAQRLTRALRACRKRRDAKRRRLCERRARGRYRASLSRRANATGKGNG